MNLIYLLLIGFLVGIVAKALMPGRESGGFLVTSLLGICGSLIASFLGQGLGLYRIGEASGFLAAVLGSMLLLLIARSLNRRSIS